MAFQGALTSDFFKKVRLDDSKKEALLNFELTDFFTLRNNLVNYIKAAYPLDYNFFVASDMGTMFLELTAAMGHILSYKADYLANENYLTTAKSRNSVRKLLSLIGIRLRGPTSSSANARLTFENAKWGTNTDYVRISSSQRVVTVTSPEDGSQVSFTLYKTSGDGKVIFDDPSDDLEIFRSEATTSSIVTNLMFLEGNYIIQEGIFTDTDAIKTIQLTQSPIVEGSIQVLIEGNQDTTGNYTQVENIFYASGPDHKVFQLATDDSFTGQLFFGDNLLGKSPNIGDSFTVYYRVGGGTRGNVGKSTINAPVSVEFFNSSNSTLGTDAATAENISLAAGGAPAQTIENAKRYAPLLFKSQDRLVTLDDYRSFINSFKSTIGTVGKGTVAVRRAFSSANIIDLYILEKANETQFKRATPEFKRQLLTAIEPKKMLTDEIVVVDGLVRTIDPVFTIKCDAIYRQRESEIKLAVRNAIVNFFNIDNIEFGRAFSAQEVNRKIFDTVPEVRYSTLDNLPQTIRLQFNEVIQLNNLSIIMAFES